MPCLSFAPHSLCDLIIMFHRKEVIVKWKKQILEEENEGLG